RRNGTNTSARRRRVRRRFAPRMLRNRSRPRRRARSRVMDSPRNLRTAYSVMPPPTMLLRIAPARIEMMAKSRRFPRAEAGVADGYGVGGGDAVGVANNGLPHWMQ